MQVITIKNNHNNNDLLIHVFITEPQLKLSRPAEDPAILFQHEYTTHKSQHIIITAHSYWKNHKNNVTIGPRSTNTNTHTRLYGCWIADTDSERS